MMLAIWILSVLLVSQYAWSVYLAYWRDRYRESAKALAEELVALRNDPRLAKPFMEGKTLTRPAPKAQDTPKRLSGAELRRASDRVNVEAFASLQERPNSEILAEEANG